MRVPLLPTLQPVQIIDAAAPLAERLALPEAWIRTNVAAAPGVASGIIITAPSELVIYFLRLAVAGSMLRTSGLGTGAPIPFDYSRSVPVGFASSINLAGGGVGPRLDPGTFFLPNDGILVPRGEQLVIAGNAVNTAFDVSVAWREVPHG